MAGEFLDLLFSFHPNDPDLRSNLVYNSRARQFVDRLSKVPAQKFVKDADTDQDPLEVRSYKRIPFRTVTDWVCSSSISNSIQSPTYLLCKLESSTQEIILNPHAKSRRLTDLEGRYGTRWRISWRWQIQCSCDTLGPSGGDLSNTSRL
jgi:hypothetical protein